MVRLKQQFSNGIAAAVVVLAFAGMTTKNGAGDESPLIGNNAPELATGTWLNSEPMTLASLKGKVVLLEFWTYGCYNCRNTLPAIKSWYKKYTGQNFTVIGVHTPEFSSEKILSNVRKRVKELGVEYPVVTDNEYNTWDAYHQEYWPVVYLIDKKGIIRYAHIGEGAYDETEREIQNLIAEK